MARPEATEKATPKRRQEARGRGQVPRSSELATAFVLLTAFIILHAGFIAWGDTVAITMRAWFTHLAPMQPVTIYSAWGFYVRAFSALIPFLIVIFVAAVAVAYAANVLQFGFLFTAYSIRPKFSKLNPLTGIQNILFSPQTLVSLAKQILKLGAVAMIIFFTVKDDLPTIYNSARNAPHDWLVSIEGITFNIAIRFALFLVAVALLDYAYQRYQLEQSLKMSRTEVKDEQRQQESSPEIRQQVRQRQRAAARRRMMSSVPKATVVVTNPTHFACALEWDEINMEAPILTAKGADLMARRIKELAKEHSVPLVENPTLARTLYYQVDLDSPVPPELYAATAQIIAFVYRLKRKTIA
jgi:flagellar biosynthetic protein FlhB